MLNTKIIAKYIQGIDEDKSDLHRFGRPQRWQHDDKN